ncbi:hypothetical protein MLD38_023779 [Melastoma candidum]|uniref:Uncharacterized protein n=1 Tax=Melastoma candidum TaxID=119954 RepID=A0ACB9NRL2_9MYRT|nr:hypothetical protein MLD38_023779 [Melastoma candidum]
MLDICDMGWPHSPLNGRSFRSERTPRPASLPISPSTSSPSPLPLPLPSPLLPPLTSAPSLPPPFPRSPAPSPSRRALRPPLTRLRLLLLLLLLAFPFFYFLVSHPTRFLLLDFLSALLLSLNLFPLPRPRLPLRLAPIKLLRGRRCPSRPLPVFWSIGPKPVPSCGGSGCWVRTYSNGDVYEGEFRKGKCSGSGVYYYYMSGRYEGDWVEGKYDGYGVETWARGSRYRGQYRQGFRHGCDNPHPNYLNGDTYAGEYFADKVHGFGIYSFANGHRYESAWHAGRRQGLGMYTFRNGETQSGHWENGILDVPSTQSGIFPDSPVAVNHSKVLNAVQV